MKYRVIFLFLVITVCNYGSVLSADSSPDLEQAYFKKHSADLFMRGSSQQQRFQLLREHISELVGMQEPRLISLFGPGTSCEVKSPNGRISHCRLYKIAVKKYEPKTGSSEVLAVDFKLAHGSVEAFEMYVELGDDRRDIVR